MTSEPILTETTRRLARRVATWRRRESHAIDHRNRVVREARLTLRAVASALGLTGPVDLLDLSRLRERALQIRGDNVALSAELRRCRDALAEALGENGDEHVLATSWLTDPDYADLEDADVGYLVELARELRDRLAQTRELNQGWARYGERVKARRDQGCPRCGRGTDENEENE